ncbi:hypothetical protein CS379_05280 [Methylobacterium frigidaeris]|uniref:DUF6894 domain-containing protein n=1 Tax=Methylobacterium frigidaeris TaxID=2038277 RepID=A0AA37H9U9_9HYPH|nr:hypothetical protein CS379_05280 [Methylobacterium frigidaeris]GJD61753.1 hypothetical protein MPEAHAMD_1899 [Methylobacterium frigidaeris]
MPCYRFRLSIDGQVLEEGGWLELADRYAALEKAHQLAHALLTFGDGRVPWADGVLVVESSDGSEPFTVPIIDMAAGEVKATRH